MIKKIKNADAVEHTWVGQTIAAGEYYTIQPEQEVTWSNDPTLLTAIVAGTAVVNNGVDDLDFNSGINLLKDNEKRNKNGAVLVDNTGRFGLPGSDSLTYITHDFSDRTTWYQRSVAVSDETLTDSGDHKLFTSANPWWVNIDSECLTYDWGRVPERNSSFTNRSVRRVVVKVNDVVVTTGYTVDFAAGTVNFVADQTGNTIKASYYHTNGVNRRSEWLLAVPPTMAILLDYVEAQFSKDVSFTTSMFIEAWAGGNQVPDATIPEVYGDFDQETYDMGFGQNKSEYRGARDFLNICTNRASQVIPAFGGLTQDVLVFPFDYQIITPFKNSDGFVLAFALKDDVPYTGELATVTLYTQILPESSL